MLLLNSLDAGELQITLSSFDVRETMRRVARQFAAAARQRGLTLSVEGDATALWLTSDEQKLERILWALIDNAVKFTPDGSIALSSRLSADRSMVEIGVRDTGVGIQNADIAQLIDDATPAPRARGLGLGLRMASRMTDFLGGRLRVRSEAGSGTHFTVAVPVFAVDPHGSGIHS